MALAMEALEATRRKVPPLRNAELNCVAMRSQFSA
jgi:hypothetical protein